MCQEIVLGSTIGLIAALGLVWLADGPLFAFKFAAVWGSAIGALIGLLLWIGSSDRPEDPVLPPAPGQERREPQRKSRARLD